MKTRLLTSFYITVALVLLFLSRLVTPYVFDAAIGILAVVGAVEVARVFERTKKYNSISLVGLYPAVLYAGIFFGLYFKWLWSKYLILFICVYVGFMALSFALTMLQTKTTKREITRYQITLTKWRFALDKALNTGFVLIYPVMFFASLFALNHYTELITVILKGFNSIELEWFFLLAAVLITVSCDSFAMLTGMLFKGPKLCPRISPKKTISGAIGGVVGGTLSALLLYLLFTLNSNFVFTFNALTNIWFVIFIGFFGSIFCQMGDILASWFKRKARVKDYGTIFPGHGGVMDRVDGLIINSTFILISVLILILIV